MRNRTTAFRKTRVTLLKRREALRRSLDLTFSQLQANLDRDVGDAVDLALDAEHHELSSQLAEVESAELAQIDLALTRIDDGEYGQCVDCGRAIPLARLRAVPYATLCVNCQRICEVEQRLPQSPLELDGLPGNVNSAAVA